MAAYERTIAALPVDDQQFTTSLAIQEILDLVIPGRAFLQKAKNDPVTQRRVEQLAPFHDKIQRDLEGRKLSNAKGDLKDYLLDEWAVEESTGVLPPFILWFPERLIVRQRNGCGPLFEAVIPPSSKALLLDAESRVEAALYAIEEADDDQVERLLSKRVGVMAFHGVNPDLAAKFFADINGKGVGVNPNLLIARDFKDPWGELALEVFKKIGIELEVEKRQVSQHGQAVVTALQARTMVAAIAFGAGAVSYGAKAIPMKVSDPQGDKATEIDWDRLRDAAVSWLGKVFERYGAKAFKSKELVLRSVPVSVALGASGRGFYTGASEEQARAYSLLGDESIDWTIGKHWAGIAGKINAAGTFSVGSGKENAWATYRALTNPEDIGYRRVRHLDDEEK